MDAIRDPFKISVDHLRDALRADMRGGEPSWPQKVNQALADVEQAFFSYSYESKAEGKFPDHAKPEHELNAALARGQQELRPKQVLMADLTRQYRQQVQDIVASLSGHSPSVNLEEVRQAGEALLDRLARYQESASHLLVDTLNTDVGGGD